MQHSSRLWRPCWSAVVAPTAIWAISLCTLILLSGIGRSPAEARAITDDLGRVVTIPDHPQRIVSLSDVDLTLPLIELGVMPIASHGRVGLDGQPTLRAGMLLMGVDFANSPIAFVGAAVIDLEAVSALKPDLILAEKGRLAALETLSQIAPTVVLDANQGVAPLYRQLAEITQRQERLQRLEARYQARLQALRQTVDPATITVAVLQPLNGKISLYHTYRALGQVLRDAGFRQLPIIEAIPAGGRIEVGIDRLPELDADVIFDPYRSDRGQGPQAEIEAMEALLPSFCSFLRACRTHRYGMVAREDAISHTYAALYLMTSMVQSHVARRPDP